VANWDTAWNKNRKDFYLGNKRIHHIYLILQNSYHLEQQMAGISKE